MTHRQQGSNQAQAQSKAGDKRPWGDRKGPGGLAVSIVDCNFTHPHAHITGTDYFAILGRPSDGTLAALGEVRSRVGYGCDVQKSQSDYLAMVYGFR